VAEKLTPQQLQAVENRGGKLLVSAAAGSGKTKVLVDRLVSYILDPVTPANIDDFLIITYTKAAAAELRGKIASKLSDLIANTPNNKHLQQQMHRLYLAKISTVHGFCTDLLRQYAYRLNIPADFRVADEGECLQLQVKALEQVLDSAYETAATNKDFCAFVDSQGLGRDDRQIPEIILKVYNSARCHPNPDGWLDWCISGEINPVDAGQTPWGQYLISDLQQYLTLQIDAFKRCVAAADGIDGMEKPVALFVSTISQLQTLCNCQTWDAIIRAKEIDFGRLTFSKKCGDAQLAEQMKAVRTACKEGLAKRLKSFASDSEQVLADFASTVGAARGLVDLVRAFTAAYDKLKSSRGILDFGDLEHKTLDLLLGKQRSGITAVANEVGECLREIMVDEYQDSNKIQDSIFNALTQKKNNCFMVGDVKQSIYQFRLADPSIFVEKYLSYVPAEKAIAGEGRKVLLSHNFRSSNGIISSVNDVFGQCMSPAVGGLTYGEDEKLREGIPHISINEPEVSLYGIDVQQDTYAEEAGFVADKISALLDGTHMVRSGDTLRPIQPEDIVILLRSPGSVGGEFFFALQQRGIPCTTGDTTDLLKTEEIATIRAILQIINNPLQDIPLVSVLTSPVFGFTAEDLALLRSRNRNECMYNLLSVSSDGKCQLFMDALQKLRNSARILPLTQLISEIYEQTHLLATYSAMEDGAIRLDNLQTFFQIASDYESTGPKELYRFLEYLDSAEEHGLGSLCGKQDTGAVTIMSIHKSKGLEFPVVFLCGLSRGFNQESARNQVLCDKDLGLGLGCVDTKLRVRFPTIAKRAISTKILRESLSEELRVLYVAMTRARDRMFMTYAVKNLSSNLQDIAMRLDMCSGELLASDADCPGAWIIQSALTRTEAGAFFALAGHPNCARVWDTQWQIEVVEGEIHNTVAAADAALSNEMQDSVIQRLSDHLNFAYSHPAATQIPSKLTATQLKARNLDTEIAEGTQAAKKTAFRKPGQPAGISGVAYGNAIHAAMQYIDFSACTSVESIQQEIERLSKEMLISPEQASVVDCEKLFRFFDSTLGKQLRDSKQVLREFKFSILDDAGKYFPSSSGEEVLLQGVVDCAVIEDDGITVLDFKTDKVTDETLSSVVEKYRGQVAVYTDALTRIYQKPIKSAYLYFFALNRLVDVT